MKFETVRIYVFGLLSSRKFATMATWRDDFSSLFRSTLVPIGRSPFLPSWKLHNVELFSAVISHLADILSWKCLGKCKSLQFEKKIGSKDGRIRTHDTDSSVHYAITSDQPFFFFFFASLFLWLERGKKIILISRERHKGMIGRGHDLSLTTLSTRPLRICWMELK